jgi:predicted nucleic acid-binding protein
VRISSKRNPHPPKDDSDIPFQHAALEGSARYLISGDPHLLDLNGKYPFSIVTPAQFLKNT